DGTAVSANLTYCRSPQLWYKSCNSGSPSIPSSRRKMMRTRYWLPFVVFAALFLPLLGAGDMRSRDLAKDAPVVRVRIYDVTDLVLNTRDISGDLGPNSMVKWLSGVRPDAEQGLGRIAKLVRMALPKEAWEEDAGPGAIEIYAERLS